LAVYLSSYRDWCKPRGLDAGFHVPNRLPLRISGYRVSSPPTGLTTTSNRPSHRIEIDTHTSTVIEPRGLDVRCCTPTGSPYAHRATGLLAPNWARVHIEQTLPPDPGAYPPISPSLSSGGLDVQFVHQTGPLYAYRATGPLGL